MAVVSCAVPRPAQPWAAVIVAVTVASYVPLTVIITERRGEVRKRMNALDNAREARATDMLLNWEVSE
jgi:ATP-binding cassette subfamily B (MDR/TAP) protein 6